MEIYSCPVPGSIRRYTRYVRLGLEELPDYSHKEHRHINIAGYNLNCKSARMRLLFLNRNWTCRCCGIRASFAAIETCPSSKGYKSLNFYDMTQTVKRFYLHGTILFLDQKVEKALWKTHRPYVLSVTE